MIAEQTDRGRAGPLRRSAPGGGRWPMLAGGGPPIALMVAVLLSCCGCGQKLSPEMEAAVEAKAYGRLPGLTAAPDEALQDELARIVEERGTPELLSSAGGSDETPEVSGLSKMFPGLDRDALAAIRAESDKLLPSRSFTLDPVRLERAIRFRRRHERPQQEFRLELDQPGCRFPIDFQSGQAADLSFLDRAWIGVRLEAFRAAESLASHKVDAALESLHYMLQAAERLAAEPHPQVRFEAAFMRTEAFLVLQSIVKDSGVTRDHLKTVHGWLAEQLERWPDDALAWIGDRALGMVFYEAARDGRLHDFLAPSEVEALRSEGFLSEFKDAVLRNVNRDELYYLAAMRKIIASCRRPYHARIADFDALRWELQAKRNEADFPLLAGRFLLPDIEKGHVIQARDRANCEGWTLAAALAAGDPPPPLEANPLTGRPYRVEREGSTIMVLDIGAGEGGDNPPWIVPDLAHASTE